ncbi:GPI-anchored surface protein, putative [Bodo saltans]|uniref:GPI-anchored surface protein, putative n=1 Tax=Bodo saltans TaxID=75058 RepID=A0A0S4J4I4_BODSA|nr:GPI-anchored surface protein, putative [Bodo saltans]|eukprot:CUG76713.1 GPI-anchored surface protein, putative [Bodo saltans]
MKTSCFQAYSSQTTVGGSAAVSSVRTSVGTPYCSPSQLLFHNDRLDAVITSHARDNLVLDINEKLASILQFYDHAVKEVTATNTLLRDGVVPQINELCAAFAPHVEIEVGGAGGQSNNKKTAKNSSREQENEGTLGQSESNNKNASTLHSVVCASSSSSSFPLSSSAPEAALDTAHGSSSAVGPPSQTSRLLNAHHRHREQNVLLSFLRDAAASIADGLYCLHEVKRCGFLTSPSLAATTVCGRPRVHQFLLWRPIRSVIHMHPL